MGGHLHRQDAKQAVWYPLAVRTTSHTASWGWGALRATVGAGQQGGKCLTWAARRCVSRATALGRMGPLRVPNLLTWVWERVRELQWDLGIGKSLGCRKATKSRGDGTTVV